MPEKFFRVYLRKFKYSIQSAGFQLIMDRHYGPGFDALINPRKANMTAWTPWYGKTKGIAEDFNYFFARYVSMFWQPEPPQT